MVRFASAAYRALESIENLNSEIAVRKEAESAVRELANGLKRKCELGLKSWNAALESPWPLTKS